MRNREASHCKQSLCNETKPGLRVYETRRQRNEVLLA